MGASTEMANLALFTYISHKIVVGLFIAANVLGALVPGIKKPVFNSSSPFHVLCLLSLSGRIEVEILFSFSELKVRWWFSSPFY